MEKNVKIIISPFTPNVEVFDKLVFKVDFPYAEDYVNVLIEPNIQEYKENDDKKDAQIRQVMITSSSKDSKKLYFDFKEDNFKKIKINDGENDYGYEIKLLHIGREKMKEGDFVYFEFKIKLVE